MFTPDNPLFYGTVSRLLHWLMAILFAFMLFTAAAWTYDEEYFGLMDYHKAVGFVLMWLVCVRLVWAIINLRRRPQGHILVKLGHGALYLLMVAVPLVGLLRQYGSARGSLDIGGITLLPASPERIDWMVQLGKQHGTLAWLLFVLIAGHIVAAVAHQIKGEKIINRMAGKPPKS